MADWHAHPLAACKSLMDKGLSQAFVTGYHRQRAGRYDRSQRLQQAIENWILVIRSISAAEEQRPH